MIGRFSYHAFWNFYDYLGTLVLCGVIYTLLAFGFVLAGIALLADGLHVITVVSLSVFLQALLLSNVLAALLPYCARASRGEPARWRHLWQGIKNQWIVVWILLLWLIVFSLLLTNFGLYFKLREQFSSPIHVLLLTVVNAIIGWTLLVVYMLLLPWLCAATIKFQRLTARAALRNGLMAVALLPGVWVLVHSLGGLLLVFGFYTKIGLVFFVPVMVSLGQTAYQLSVQYSTFLAQAKEELGSDLSLRHYKRRADELAWEWENREPRRTIKELVRPWE